MSNFIHENRTKEFWDLLVIERKKNKKLLEQCEEYKACKQHWYDKYMKLHNTLIGNIKGEFNEPE